MKSEFLESELELYVQRLLTHEFYSTGRSFRMRKISPYEEKLKGYDAEIIGMQSFYCQFKTSDFLTKGNTFNDRINLCREHGFPETPFYCFKLREPSSADKSNPKLWQHNVLHNLWLNNKNNTAYVAPLFHRRYELDLHEPMPFRHTNFCLNCGSVFRFANQLSYYEQQLRKSTFINGQKLSFHLPSFYGLISIPPHTLVTELDHKYCYNSPADISFHSEPVHVANARLFSDSLEQFIIEGVNTEKRLPDNKMKTSEIQNLIGLGESELDKAFLETFLRYGIRQTLRSDVDSMSHVNSIDWFNDLNWLNQRVVFASSLQAFFGIATLGLFEYEN